MWGMAGWTGSDDAESLAALERAVGWAATSSTRPGPTATATASACSAELVARAPGPEAATSPPRSRRRTSVAVAAAAPAWTTSSRRSTSAQYAAKSLENLGLPRIDLLQFHVWEDAWATTSAGSGRWTTCKRAGADPRRRHQRQPLGAGERAARRCGPALVDAVQVIYNIFDQAPEDELFPLCRELDIGVIARVPFDEGTLTGTLTRRRHWPEGDWRNTYFVPENLAASVERAERAAAAGAGGDDDAGAGPALHPGRPGGLRRSSRACGARHVEANLAASDGRPLDPALLPAARTPLGPHADALVAVSAAARLLPRLALLDCGLELPGGEPFRSAVVLRSAALQVALRRGDEGSAVAAASALAGLGEGSTPAGDDYLVGVVHALRAAGASASLVAALGGVGDGRTTALSASWLAAAARGEASPVWGALLAALAGSDEAAVAAAAAAVRATGHTSGAYSLRGFVETLAPAPDRAPSVGAQGDVLL